MKRKHVKTLGEVAEVLGISQPTLSKYTKKSWWPRKNRWGWPVEKCQAAFESHVARRVDGRGRKRRDRPASSAPDEIVLSPGALTDPASTPLEVTRATMRLIAAQLSAQASSGSIDEVTCRALKQALEELRRAEKAYIDLAERTGELVQRDAAKAAIGRVTQRLCAALEDIESTIAARVERWLGDSGWLAMPTENRGREVRRWVAGRARELRETTADDIEAMIVEEAEG